MRKLNITGMILEPGPSNFYFWFKYNLHRSSVYGTHHKLDPTGVRTLDLKDHGSTFLVTETPALTTLPSLP